MGWGPRHVGRERSLNTHPPPLRVAAILAISDLRSYYEMTWKFQGLSRTRVNTESSESHQRISKIISDVVFFLILVIFSKLLQNDVDISRKRFLSQNYYPETNIPCQKFSPTLATLGDIVADREGSGERDDLFPIASISFPYPPPPFYSPLERLCCLVRKC